MNTIFLGSTLIDMQTERKLLNEAFIKDFNNLVSSYSNPYCLIDLAYGLNPLTFKDDLIKKKIIQVMEKEIRKSSYYIFFVGDKAGFTIYKRDNIDLINGKLDVLNNSNDMITLTELQTRNASSYMSSARFLFCFRNLDPNTIPDDLKDDYIETDPQNIELLNNYKEYIKKNFPEQLIYYDASFNNENELVIEEGFKERLLSKLEDTTLKVQRVTDDKSLVKNKQFIQSVKKTYNVLFNYEESDKNKHYDWGKHGRGLHEYVNMYSAAVFVVKGAINNYKTPTLSLLRRNRHGIFIPAYVSPHSQITTLYELMKYLVYTTIIAVKEHLPKDHKHYYLILKKLEIYTNKYYNATYETLAVYFNELIEMLTFITRKKVFVVIDGLDKLVDEKNIRNLSFIRSFFFMDISRDSKDSDYLGYNFTNIHFIISARDDYKFSYYTSTLLGILEIRLHATTEKESDDFKIGALLHFETIINQFNLNKDLFLILQTLSLMDYGFNKKHLIEFCNSYNIHYNELDFKTLINNSSLYFSEKSNVAIDFSREIIKEALNDDAYNNLSLIKNLKSFLLLNKDKDDNYLYTLLNLAYKTNDEELIQKLLINEENYHNYKFFVQVNNYLVYNELKDCYFNKDIILNINNYIFKNKELKPLSIEKTNEFISRYETLNKGSLNNNELYLSLYHYYVYILKINYLDQPDERVEQLIELELKQYNTLNRASQDLLIELLITYSKLINNELKHYEMLKELSLTFKENSLNKLEFDLLYGEALIKDKEFKKALGVYNNIITSIGTLKKNNEYDNKIREFYSYFSYKYAKLYSYIDDDVNTVSIITKVVEEKLKKMQQDPNVFTIKRFLKAYLLYDDIMHSNQGYSGEFTAQFINKLLSMLQHSNNKDKYVYECSRLNAILLHTYVLYSLSIKELKSQGGRFSYKLSPIPNLKNTLKNLDHHLLTFYNDILPHKDRSERHNHLYGMILRSLKLYYTLDSFNLLNAHKYYNLEIEHLLNSNSMLKNLHLFNAYRFGIDYIITNNDSYVESLSNEAFKNIESLLVNKKELYLVLNYPTYNLLLDFYTQLLESSNVSFNKFYNLTTTLFKYVEEFYFKKPDVQLAEFLLTFKHKCENNMKKDKVKGEDYNKTINLLNNSEVLKFFEGTYDPSELVDLMKNETDNENLYLYAMILKAVTHNLTKTHEDNAISLYLTINDAFNKIFSQSVFEPFIILNYFNNIKNMINSNYSKNINDDDIISIIENMLVLEELNFDLGFTNIKYLILYDALKIIENAFYNTKHNKRLNNVINKYLKFQDKLIEKVKLTSLNVYQVQYQTLKIDYLIGVFYAANKDYNKALDIFYNIFYTKTDELNILNVESATDLNNDTKAYHSLVNIYKDYSVNAIILLYEKGLIKSPSDKFLLMTVSFRSSNKADPKFIEMIKKL